MTTKQMLLLFAGGAAVMVLAVLFDLLSRDPDLPNDANIGAGIIFMIGFMLIIVGVVGKFITVLTDQNPKS